MSLHRLIKDIVKNQMKVLLHTVIPGRVVNYYYDDNKKAWLADVEPAFYELGLDEPEPMDIVEALPVRNGFGGLIVQPPVDEVIDQDCTMLVSQRSIDKWLENGGTQVDQEDANIFNLSDSFVVLGNLSNGKSIKEDIGNNEGLVKYGKSKVVFSKSSISIESENTQIIGNDCKVLGSSIKLGEGSQIKDALEKILKVFQVPAHPTGAFPMPNALLLTEIETAIKGAFEVSETPEGGE